MVDFIFNCVQFGFHIMEKLPSISSEINKVEVNKSYKETSELQNETISDLGIFITRTFNQININ